MLRNALMVTFKLSIIGSILGLTATLPASQPPALQNRPPIPAPAWNNKAAADYLDKRNAWWQHNMGAIDHGTACIACHTAFPYALARPTLRRILKETKPGDTETQVQQSIFTRVRQCEVMQPFLNAPAQSRGAESVMNALVLARAQDRTVALTADTAKAMQTMWDRQIQSGAAAGAWPWFGDGGGGEEPWEAYDSQYWGAAIAALAVGTLTPNYQYSAAIRPNLAALKKYLLAGEPQQSLHNRLTLLWASTKLPGFLDGSRQTAIVQDIVGRRKPDGGWRVEDLVSPTWKRFDGSDYDTGSDGYATAYAAFILKQVRDPAAQDAARSGREWLERHQDRATGAWAAASWNKKRDPASDVGKFMSDAATAYAVLALTGAE